MSLGALEVQNSSTFVVTRYSRKGYKHHYLSSVVVLLVVGSTFLFNVREMRPSAATPPELRNAEQSSWSTSSAAGSSIATLMLLRRGPSRLVKSPIHQYHNGG